MRGKTAKYISIAAVLLIILFSAMLLTDTSFGYEYKYESKGVLILSDFKDPQQYFPELSMDANFLLVTNFPSSSDVKSYMGTGMQTLLTVLTGNGRNTVNIVKSTTAMGAESCFTNYGDVKSVEELTREECESYISSRTDAVKIFLFAPDNSLPAAQIILYENEIHINPKIPAELPGISLLAAEFLYPNAREVIEQTNELAGSLGG